MAKLNHAVVGDRLYAGRYVEQTFRFTTTADAADEFIDTGWREIVSVVGFAPKGTSAVTASVVFVKNAQGTGQSEGSSPGKLGVETDVALTDLEVTVRGLL